MNQPRGGVNSVLEVTDERKLDANSENGCLEALERKRRKRKRLRLGGVMLKTFSVQCTPQI